MSVLFVTGAGISASAGIPTYRDGGSSWRDEDLEKKSHASRYGNHLDELWDKHWGPVQAQMMVSQPTAAHLAIAKFQQAHPSIIATQNIDDLHERASSDNVAHVHGEMNPICMRCKSKNIHSWVGVGAPNCMDCDSRKTRPDVVLFGENLNKKMFRGIQHYANSCTHLVVVGSSLIVQPIGGLVMDVLSSPARTILINTEPVPLSKWFTETYYEPADEVTETVLEGVHEDLGR